MKLLFLLVAAVFPAAIQNDVLSPEEPSDTSVVVLTIEDALKIAMSENIAVKVADKEIMRTKYAKKGTYAALYPQVDGSFSFQRTLKKQTMYMDVDLSDFSGMGSKPSGETASGESSSKDTPSPSGGGGGKSGFEVGRYNNWTGGITASMPLVNAQLWQSLKISGQEVELAVEKARGSRLDMVTQVKEAFYGVLLAKDVNEVMEKAYENAVKNLEVTRMKYNSQKISDVELLRAKTTVANALPDLYNSRNSIDLALWQLKAVMGLDLDYNIDCAGSLSDFAGSMFYDLHANDDADLSANTSLKQLEIQVEELANTIKMQQYAYIPSLSLAFNYSYNAMANDFDFSQYQWKPYSYIGLSIQIPIFSGFKRLNNVRQAKVQYDELKLQQLGAQRQLRIAIKQYLSTMETDMNSYYAAESAVETARKGYEISSKSYQVGRCTLIELNDALLALEQASLSQWQAVYSFLVAKANLEKELGMDYSVEQ